MEKMIVANQKMNLNMDEIDDYINKLVKSNFKPIIFPTSIYIPFFVKKGFDVGIQNIYFENSGQFTGEISPMQAKSIGVKYVLIGHSDRRRVFNETDEEVNLKVKKALENDLKVILCVGENTYEDYKEVLYNQITKGLKGVDKEVIISYEPVYAIGSGVIPSFDEITENIKYIKSLFDYDVKVLYGGSVNMETSKILKKIDLISGYLIGSKSNDVDEFIKIGEVLM